MGRFELLLILVLLELSDEIEHKGVVILVYDLVIDMVSKVEEGKLLLLEHKFLLLVVVDQLPHSLQVVRPLFNTFVKVVD